MARRISVASLGAAAVAAAVAIAFADSSIVVLALPQLLDAAEHVDHAGVSWVITAYNLVVAVVALALGSRLGRASARRVGLAGLAVFLAGVARLCRSPARCRRWSRCAASRASAPRSSWPPRSRS